MAKFDAANAVEAMDFDFSAYGGPIGVIPEPSNGQVDAFFKTAKALAKSMKDKTGVSPEDADKEMSAAEVQEVIASMTESEDDDAFAEYEEQMTAAIAELCSHFPSQDDIKRLPFRIRTAFMSWLVGELRPESTRPGTKR